MLENTLFWNIFNFLDIFIYFILFKVLVSNFSEKVTSNKINQISLILTSIISFNVGYKNILIYIFLSIIFYKINYNTNTLKSIVYSCIYWIIIYKLIEYISLELVCMANYLNIHSKVKVMDASIVLLENFMFKIILILVLYSAYVYIKKCYKIKQIISLYIIIPIVTNILFLLLAFRYKVFNIDFNIELIIIFLFISLSNIIFFVIFKIVFNNYKVKLENEILMGNILKEQNYYSKIHKEQEKVKEIYHDIKNHMICIRDMCENNNTKNIINYIDDIEFGLNKYKSDDYKFNTGNMILDSILKNKKLLCEDKSIKFEIKVDFSKSDYMNMIDVCIIFSNIIDNAIEACSNIKSHEVSKNIRIESKYIESFCIIIIENTKINKIKQKNNIFLTNKKDKVIHGLGLRNVKNSLKKYSGELFVEDYKNKFILKIMIPVID